jgi:hypothetical protein
MSVFRNDAEAARYWDKADAAEYMEGGTLKEFVWKSVEDRCDRCGGKMKTKVSDLRLMNGEVTIRRVKVYHCPSCGRERPSKKFRDRVPLITRDLVKMALM